MAVQKIALKVGEGLSLDDLFEALEEHRDKIKGLLLSNLEYVSARATCDGFVLEEVTEDSGKLSLKYNFDWSAYYGCRDANDGGTRCEEVAIGYKDGIVTIEYDVKPERFPNEEL